jgi:hypothetical protein
LLDELQDLALAGSELCVQATAPFKLIGCKYVQHSKNAWGWQRGDSEAGLKMCLATRVVVNGDAGLARAFVSMRGAMRVLLNPKGYVP